MFLSATQAATTMVTALRPIILILILFALAAQFMPRSALASADPGHICAAAVRQAETSHRVPRLLLHAVSLAESGRWHKDRQASIAWPWTVTAQGAGKYYPDRAAAIAAVKRLKAEGVRNIDVGCMQINLMYHANAFDDIEQAFDPLANTTYAAQFLKSLRSDAGSWAHAVARYHSSNWKSRGQPYWRKVHRLWNKERWRDFRERRAERKKNYREKHRQAATQVASQ